MHLRHARTLVLAAFAGLSCGDEKAATTTDDATAQDSAPTDTVFVEVGDVVGFDSEADGTPSGTHDGNDDDGQIVAGGFGAPCQGNGDCLDGFCVEGPEGFVCTKGCETECPSGYDCRGVQSGSADTVFLCLPRVARVCVPCKADYQCPNGACLEIGVAGECSFNCESDNNCPGGYHCGGDPGGTHPGQFCLPNSGSCDCTPDSAGAVRTCTSNNDFGTCYGVETCDAQAGWVGCTAASAVAEICDGRDNDCDALVDDGVETNTPCENTIAGIGTCHGVSVCVGTQGNVCTAATPEVEACDFRDNDCDGEIDEDFKDADGQFTLPEHCGTCNNDCSEKIANGTGRCEVVEGASPVCVVAACDPDYVELNRFQCALPPDVSCLPCASADDCYDGSCTALDGQQVCVVPCGDSGSCQEGYACEDVAGEDRCVPVSGSCLCNPGTDGQIRTCVRTSVSGTCYGQETCDAAAGWSGCTARDPGEEVCNGVDDDCSSAVDDVLGRGDACAITNTAGTCAGVRDCKDGETALACVGQTPVAETCNYEDDDCDGQTDEGYSGLYSSCSNGVGACQRYGFVACKADGSGTECNAVAGPSGNESCDRLDNNCDGKTDETYLDLGEVCSTGEGACRGFGTKVCKADGLGTQCTAVAGASKQETCDLVDNDCDGATDNGFKNPAGKYANADHCGNCFTDCTVIYDKAHANGICDASGADPVCAMLCDAGYYNLNAAPDDGCEFVLDATALYVSESDTHAVNDGNCGAGPSQTGGGRYPCKTITYAIGKAGGAGKTRVNVAGGAYNENLTLVDGISVYGGFNPLNWVRDPQSNLTAVFGVQASGQRKTVVADAITVKDTSFDGFAVYGQVANGIGENSYAIWVRNSSGKLHLSNNTIWPGTGGPGQNGTRGTDGAEGGGGSAGAQAKSIPGNPSCWKNCSGSNPGGGGGTNGTCGSGTAGGAGASAPCPDYNESVDLCTSNTGGASQSSNPKGTVGSGSGGGAGGGSGCDQLTDPTITGCNCSVPGTIANCPTGEFSTDGGDGGQGTRGNAGTKNGVATGEIFNGEWRGFGGGTGGNGAHGAGGGGGGAGGGVESYYNSSTGQCGGSTYSDFGGSGGGGGAGGCGGTGGSGGSGGGGAFGIFYLVTTGLGSDLPTMTNNDVHLGFGGSGGRGGDGGTAGDGGPGALGGAAAPGTLAWCAQPGSKGGEGGDGGPGGGGAGGAGGVAYGIYVSGGSLPVWASGNTFFSDGAGGPGGPGGGTGAGGAAGEPGLTGAAAATNF